jgi:hypothetical protein
MDSERWMAFLPHRAIAFNETGVPPPTAFGENESMDAAHP